MRKPDDVKIVDAMRPAPEIKYEGGLWAAARRFDRIAMTKRCFPSQEVRLRTSVKLKIFHAMAGFEGRGVVLKGRALKNSFIFRDVPTRVNESSLRLTPNVQHV